MGKMVAQFRLCHIMTGDLYYVTELRIVVRKMLLFQFPICKTRWEMESKPIFDFVCADIEIWIEKWI